MKKFLLPLVILLTFALANSQSTPNPHPGYTFSSSNCNSVNLGIVTITTGEETWVNPNNPFDVLHIPCKKDDRWHWFWE